MRIDGKRIGSGDPVYIIAEIGINHNGQLSKALHLIDAAKDAGADAVKFQKRTPALVVPTYKRNDPKETPWGHMTYLEYKERLELSIGAYAIIHAHCMDLEITWFASPWDVESVDFLEDFDVPAYKVASASVTDISLLRQIAATDKPVIMSTGMSEMDDVYEAVANFSLDEFALMNCVATYPAQDSDLNLSGMETLRKAFGVPVGHSGHELGIATTVAAVAMGAELVERHITLNRAFWGSDQAASLEPQGFKQMVRDIRAVERAWGNGVITIQDCERDKLADLRGS